MGWRRTLGSEGKAEKIHESKLKWSLASYESEASTANGIGLFPEGRGEILCDSPLDDEKERTSFPRSENNNFFLLSNLPASSCQERSQLFYQLFI